MDELAPLGFNPQTRGYRRFSWTDTDLALRHWFRHQAARRQLTVDQDRNGNLWAILGAPERDDLVAIGSHLDSVPDGGAYDGALGVASAFAALDRLRERGWRPQRSVAVVSFTEEEGARFGVACLGSRLLTGAIEAKSARTLTDAAGVSLERAMTEAGEDPGLLGPDRERLGQLRCYVELHIEQGRGLVDLGQPVAIGSEIWPHGRWRIELAGRADHAGTTRMEDRDDPIARFADVVSRVFATAQRLGARATFGRLVLEPNATNSIPSRVIAWLDARASDRADLEVLLETIAPDAPVGESFTSGIVFDPKLAARIADLLGHPPSLATAAGHDAGILAEAGIPSAMLFVRNPTGVSHSPEESATPEDCQTGVEALATVISDLAGSR